MLVRDAVPKDQPVSAKIRLGFDDTSLALENADAITQAGADLLTIHARTKVDGYRPPAYWEWIAKIKEVTDIPIIANGEIWSAEDAILCQQRSGCQDLMLGRGALAMPNLAQTIKQNDAPMSWEQTKELLVSYSGYEIYSDKGRYYPNRIKQWFNYLKKQYPEAESMFVELRKLKHADDIVQMLTA